MTELLSIAEAAKRAGISRSTMFRQVKRGKVSAKMNPDKGDSYEIDPAELARVYPKSVDYETEVQQVNSVSETQAATSDYNADYVELLEQTVKDQRRQLDAMTESRERLEEIIQQQSETLAESQQLLLTHDDQGAKDDSEGRAVRPPQSQATQLNSGGFIAALKKRFIGSEVGTADSQAVAQR